MEFRKDLLCNTGLMENIQKHVYEWAMRNFPNPDKSRSILRSALGVCEEAGELAHAVLKNDQGIRGTGEQHDADTKDAIGDIIIYAMNLCGDKGWSIEEIIINTVEKVTKRDWIKDPEKGVADGQDLQAKTKTT